MHFFGFTLLLESKRAFWTSPDPRFQSGRFAVIVLGYGDRLRSRRGSPFDAGGWVGCDGGAAEIGDQEGGRVHFPKRPISISEFDSIQINVLGLSYCLQQSVFTSKSLL